MTESDFYTAIKINAEALRCVSQRFASKTLLQSLTDMRSAPAAYISLKEACGRDDDGLKMLACMLQAARYTHDKYAELNISDDIFIDTLACFTRFTEEYRKSYGKYGFDRGWWAYRQLACVLFKIGELEYEYRDDEKTVHLHIPTGAHIDIENCKRSFDKFTAFTESHLPDKNYPIVCHSWLLSPALDGLLPADSNILSFKRCFDISEWDKTQRDFIQWIYGKPNINLNDLPEETSLQKNVKLHLMLGGYIGCARGVLKKFV